MITHDYNLQCLRCMDCGHVVEIPKHIVRNPEAIALGSQIMAKQHRGCTQTLKERVWERVKREIRAVAL